MRRGWGRVLEQEGWGSEERLEMVECWSKSAGGVRRGWGRVLEQECWGSEETEKSGDLLTV